MHYYKRNLGDYAKKAGRLSMLQHGSYTLLIDACYDREQFPTLEDAIEWTWASTTDEIEAVTFVLRKFFILESGFYVQKRIKEEIEEYQGKAETNKRIAIERETKRKENNTNRAKDSTYRVQDVNESPPNQEPITNNHKPLTNSIKNIVDSDAVNCPHQEIIKLYSENLPMLTQVKVWSDKRKRLLKARWCEDNKRQNLDWWNKFFVFIAKSDFLTGKVTDWQADIEWILNSSNFIKILEGKYENKNG